MSDIYYAVAHRSQEEIDSFKTRYDKFDTKYIPEIFRDSLNLKVSEIIPSTSWGSSHVIYFVKVSNSNKLLVFRANIGFNKIPEAVMKAEKLICDQVLKLNIPTNKILYVNVSRNKYPFDFQIQECLDGSDIENNFKGSKKEYDKLSFDLGVYIAKYSQMQFEGYGMFEEKTLKNNVLKGRRKTFYEYITICLFEDLKYLVRNNVITTAVEKQIIKIFEEYRPVINNVKKGSLVHHDLADHNIFFKDNKITGIFDWETAVSGDPTLDLASAPTWRTFYPRENILIDGYKSITKLPDFFEEKMNIYRLRTMLWKIVYAIRMNILNDARKQKFLESLKPFKLFIS
ncbi:MAG: phosphotransferase [Patescibacteria group bacterium]